MRARSETAQEHDKASELLITHTSSLVPNRVLGERIYFLATHGQTGSYEVYLHEAPKDAGLPPHFHPWDEAFYVIDGDVDFTCGGICATVKAGGFVHVPAGTVHPFRCASATAKVLDVTSGNGATTMFTAVDRECDEFTDIEHVVGVLGAHDVTDAIWTPFERGSLEQSRRGAGCRHWKIARSLACRRRSNAASADRSHHVVARTTTGHARRVPRSVARAMV